MERYHINWTTGMPQACTRRECDEEHRDDPVAASREIYEVEMSRFMPKGFDGWTKQNPPPRY